MTSQPLVIPLRIKQPASGDLAGLSRRLQHQLTPTTIRPHVDSGRALVAMGAIRTHARNLSRERVNIDVEASVAGAIRRIDQVRRHAQQLRSDPAHFAGNAAGGFFGRRAAMTAAGTGALAAGGVVAGGVLAGGAVAGAGALKIAGDGISGLADLEKYEATLGVILRDQTKANALLDQLKDIDIKLPVDLSLLADAATKLAGSGFDSANIASDVTAILDAASISTDGVAMGTERIVRAFSQIKSNGRLLGEEINQLTETGIPIRQIIQEQFGMDTRALSEKSQAGEIDIDTILSGLIKGFQVRFGGSLQKQSQQLSGQLDQLADKYRAFSREVAEPIFDPLKDSLRALNEALDSQAFDDITVALKSVAEATGPFITKLGIIARMTVAGAGATTNAGRGLAPKVATTGLSIASKGLALKNRIDDATGGLFGKSLGMTPLALQGRVGMKAVDTITGGVSSATRGAAAFANANRPKPSPEDPKAKTSAADVASAIGNAIKDKFGAITSMLPALTSAVTDKAASFAKSTGIDFDKLPQQARDLQRSDVLKADESKRFDSAVSSLPGKLKDFADTISDPEQREAFNRSTFRVTQQRDDDGRMMPQVELQKLGEMASRGSVERTGLSGLNSMVQSNVDQQRDQELQQKQIGLSEQIAKWTEETAKALGNQSNEPKTAVIAPG